jgi:hypothetical protein
VSLESSRIVSVMRTSVRGVSGGRGSLAKNRVDPASCLAGPPTDPDVRISRIRLLVARLRCAT